VETLVKLGIDVNAKNDVDMTALHYAAWDATIETCKKLMELGVDVGHKAKGKLSALDLAERRSKETSGRMVAKVLREAMGIEEVVQAPGGDWVSDPDSEWRKVCFRTPSLSLSPSRTLYLISDSTHVLEHRRM
jgi:hypothetical protein